MESKARPTFHKMPRHNRWDSFSNFVNILERTKRIFLKLINWITLKTLTKLSLEYITINYDNSVLCTNHSIGKGGKKNSILRLNCPRKLEITHIFTVVPKDVNVMCSSHFCVGVVSSKNERDFEPTTEGLVEHETGLERGYEREPWKHCDGDEDEHSHPRVV